MASTLLCNKGSEALTYHEVSHRLGTRTEHHSPPASLQEHLDLCKRKLSVMIFFAGQVTAHDTTLHCINLLIL